MPLEIEALPVDEVENSLTGLIKTVALFNHGLPHLTRASLTAIDGWLTHVNQNGVSHRLGLAYPNTEGVAEATNIFMSLQEFTKEVQDGAIHLTKSLKRSNNGHEWLVGCYYFRILLTFFTAKEYVLCMYV